MDNLILQRILHPIGQGSFYTEQFYHKDSNSKTAALLTVVYDCGSQNKEPLKREIKKMWSSKDIIDIMFLSHLDKDHINGIETIKSEGIRIKYLVLPFLKEHQKLLVCLATEIEDFSADALKREFNAENIILVRAATPENNQSEFMNRAEPRLIQSFGVSADNGYIEIPSGSKLKGHNDVDWMYVPFNIGLEEEYKEFEEFVKTQDEKLGIKINKQAKSILPFEQSKSGIFTKTDLNNLKKIYSKFTKTVKKNRKNINKNGHNERNWSSLIVLSTPTDSIKIKNRCWIDIEYMNFCWFCRCPYIRFKRRFYSLEEKPAILYLGDINLNMEFKESPSSTLSALDFIKREVNKYVDMIGMLQIPHHGSMYSFNSELPDIFDGVPTFFYSYGTSNTYGHPSNDIKPILLLNNKFLFEVNEYPYSAVKLNYTI